jgi:hypothetical protein
MKEDWKREKGCLIEIGYIAFPRAFPANSVVLNVEVMQDNKR